MRRQSIGRWTAAALLAGLVAGCETTPDAGGDAAGEMPPTGDQLADAQHAPELQAVLARLDAIERENRELRHELGARDRAEIEARRLLQQQRGQTPPDPGTANPGPVTIEGGNAGDTSNNPPTVADTAPDVGLDGFSDDELVEALMGRIADGTDAARVRALRAAALSMLTRRHDLDYTLLEALDPADREMVVRFHQLMAITFEEIAAGQADRLSRRDMFEKVEEVFGDPPLRFDTIDLCRRVDGYGVFTPLPSHRFLTGRRNTTNGGVVHDAVLYMELENFVRHPTTDGQYEVKVSWELELYDSTGTVPLWRQPPAIITDVSQNRRRDFFLAQTIDLPTNLEGGGYLLKIRVIDQHSGARAERTLTDLQFVADPALLGG